MIDEPASRSNQRGITNRDTPADIELTPGTDEHVVANPDAGISTPDSIVLEDDTMFNQASPSQRHLMRPGYPWRGHNGAPSDGHALYLQGRIEA